MAGSYVSRKFGLFVADGCVKGDRADDMLPRDFRLVTEYGHLTIFGRGRKFLD